jgi:hypothetical protein
MVTNFSGEMFYYATALGRYNTGGTEFPRLIYPLWEDTSVNNTGLDRAVGINVVYRMGWSVT